MNVTPGSTPPPPPALLFETKITGKLYDDRNYNGVFDDGDIQLNIDGLEIGLISDDNTTYTQATINDDGTYEIKTTRQLGYYAIMVTSSPNFGVNYFLPQTRFHSPFTFEGWEQDIPVFRKSPNGCIGTVSTPSKDVRLQYGQFNLVNFDIYPYENVTTNFPPYCQVTLSQSVLSIKYKTNLNLALFNDINLDGNSSSTILSQIKYDVISTVEGNLLQRAFTYPADNQIDLPSTSRIVFDKLISMVPIIDNYLVTVENPNIISTINESIGFIVPTPSKIITFVSSDTSEILSLTYAKFTSSFFANIGWNHSLLSFSVGDNQTVIYSNGQDVRIFDSSPYEYSVSSIVYGNIEIVNPNLFPQFVPNNGLNLTITNDYPFGTPTYSIDGVQIVCVVASQGNLLECTIPEWTSGSLTKQITSTWNSNNLFDYYTITYLEPTTTTGTTTTTSETTLSSTTESSTTSSTTGGSTTTTTDPSTTEQSTTGTTDQITTTTTTTGTTGTTDQITTTTTTTAEPITTGPSTTGTTDQITTTTTTSSTTTAEPITTGQSTTTSTGSTTGGNPTVGHLSGYIFDDANLNNFFDSGESALSNISVQIVGPSVNIIVNTNTSGLFDLEISSTGLYSIKVISTSYFMPEQVMKVSIANIEDYQVNVTVFSKSGYGCLGTIRNSFNKKLSVQYGAIDLSLFNYQSTSLYDTYSLPSNCYAQKNGSILTVQYKSNINLQLYIDENFNGMLDATENSTYPTNVTLIMESTNDGINISRTYPIEQLPLNLTVNVPNNSTIRILAQDDVANITTIYNTKYYIIAKPNTISNLTDNFGFLTANPNNTISISNNSSLSISLPYGKFNWTFFENIDWNNSLVSIDPSPDQLVIVSSITERLNITHNNQSTVLSNFNITYIEIVYLDLFTNISTVPINGGIIQLKNIYWSGVITPVLSIGGITLNCSLLNETTSFVNCSVPPYTSGPYSIPIDIVWNGMILFSNGTINYEVPVTTSSSTTSSGIATTSTADTTTTTSATTSSGLATTESLTTTTTSDVTTSTSVDTTTGATTSSGIATTNPSTTTTTSDGTTASTTVDTTTSATTDSSTTTTTSDSTTASTTVDTTTIATTSTGITSDAATTSGGITTSIGQPTTSTPTTDTTSDSATTSSGTESATTGNPNFT
ncbi:hypothetical protein PPL_07863 [Heterostelium album PN500]|uniref:SD-repeat containing protein B domain-containing protein n=1 Tax=Heterostelium pallidum (strain ATCC 26659 / Pp 5 / PN500) TaxID=670386 RepID=D3BH61_HETP5|nr:hypothetical protein PPL_07863 [Heterostelium album PN500]EFA79445.1 hypothetical protein PPL_07863 [Heterostelium album PN500]|eukprot:XP_020431566.1 hypothetical protein PPL_07863 [Heterostelium album PN500]